MSVVDQRLRQLERSDDPIDQARLLRERKRLGSTLMVQCNHSGLNEAYWERFVDNCLFCNDMGKRSLDWKLRLRLAAYCGHAGARLALDKNPFVNTYKRMARWRMETWLRGLRDYPVDVLEIAALAACNYWLETLKGNCASTPNETCCACDVPHQALQAVEAYFKDRSDMNRESCLRVGSMRDPCEMLAGYLGANDSIHGCLVDIIRQCGKVKEEICKRLIAWTLDSDN